MLPLAKRWVSLLPGVQVVCAEHPTAKTWTRIDDTRVLVLETRGTAAVHVFYRVMWWSVGAWWGVGGVELHVLGWMQ